jgi:Concanavalin A-like lectin/glucanases superfamily
MQRWHSLAWALLIAACGDSGGAASRDGGGASPDAWTKPNLPTRADDAGSDDAAVPEVEPDAATAERDAALGESSDAGGQAGPGSACEGAACPCPDGQERVGVTCLPRLLYGAIGAADGDGYSTSGVTGLGGASSGFWVAALVHLTATPSRSTAIAGRGSFPGGWVLVSHGGQFQLQLGISTPQSSVSSASPLRPFDPSDVGKTHLVVGVFDGSTVRLYVDAELVGAPQPASMLPYELPFMVGARPDNALYANREYIVAGVMGGNAAPTLAEVTGLYERVKAERKLTPIAGKTDRLYAFAPGDTPQGVSDAVTGGDSIAPLGSERLVAFTPDFAW